MRAFWIAGFAVLLTALVVLEVLGRTRKDLPHGGRIVTYLMRSHPGRWAVVFGWWWLGWHLFVR